MNKIFIKVSENRLWILDYNFVCALFFIPITAYASVKIRKTFKSRKIRIAIKKNLARECRIKELEKLYRILKLSGSSLSPLVLLKILHLRGGSDDFVVVPGVDDCVSIDNPSYVNDERILRFINDRLSKLAIKGIVYITKEAFCYLVAKEGLVDFPVVFLERVKIDGIYSFIKTTSEWTVVSIGVTLALGGVIAPQFALVYFGFAWLYIHSLEILTPRVKDVNKITGKFIPRIATKKDAIVFDVNNEPLPPVIEKSIKPIKISTLETEYEITEKKLVDVATVSGLKNKFSDRRFKRGNRKLVKPVYFSDMVKKWRGEDKSDDPAISIIDKMIEEDII